MLKTTVASAEVIEEGADWKRAIEAWLKVASQYPESEIGRVRLELLIQLRVDDEVSNEFFFKLIAMEKDIFESELHAIAIITKAAAQRAANAAIDVLSAAISTLVPKL
jgi:hypothetical protein